MTVMVRRSKKLGERVSEVDDARDMAGQARYLGWFSTLESRSAGCQYDTSGVRPAGINHQDGRGIVLVQRSWTAFRVPEFRED